MSKQDLEMDAAGADTPSSVEPVEETEGEAQDAREDTTAEGEAEGEAASELEAEAPSLAALEAGEDADPTAGPDDFLEDIPPDPGSADDASPRLQSIVESLLFAADKPLGLRQLGDLVGETELERVRAAVAATERDHESRGFQLHQVAGGYQFRTHPQNAVWVQKLLAQKPIRLSRALLETLAIVAYRQPITRPEIDQIRGVDSGGTLKTLMERSLVRILGKKEEPGRPMLYGTTREFLEFFNLGDLKGLPTLREFHELSEEHQAQVAALEGVAPEGSIEPPEGEPPPPLRRLEVALPADDPAELAEIDRLIQTAGMSVATDSDLGSAEVAEAEFEETEPTQPFGEQIQVPLVEQIDEEFDRSEETTKRQRPDGLDDDDEDLPGKGRAG